MVFSIKAAVDGCANYASDVRRRNNTLIDYYIYPKPTPTAIAAYDPRLATLESRINSIKKLDFNQLEMLFDDPDCLAASYLNNIIQEILNAISGSKHLFEKHYDPSLRQRAPYAASSAALEILQNRLHVLISTRLSKPNRPRAEHFLSQRNSSGHQFCRGGVQVLNGNDRGRIANVSEKDLLSSNREVLADIGGAYLWWKCPSGSCAFKLRFHILGSQASSIHSNSEVRSHPSIPLEYRSIFLVKSHLRLSSSIPGTTKYGCLFCFAEGRSLRNGETAFCTGKELAMHICSAHKGGKLPPAMVLQKVRVAVGGQCPIGVKRWDVNFLKS